MKCQVLLPLKIKKKKKIKVSSAAVVISALRVNEAIANMLMYRCLSWNDFKQQYVWQQFCVAIMNTYV